MTGRRVLVIGATGLVGRALVDQLLEEASVARVVVLARRPFPQAGTRLPGKLESHVVDFERLDGSAAAFDGVQQLFCALGTTIRQAGSQARFREVDHDLPLQTARIGLDRGVRHYLLVSAIGADPVSRVFYNRVKGELERDLRELGYEQLTIVRPSLLIGQREERRLGEEVARRLAWAVPRRWAPVRATAVARALVEAARRREPGTRVIESGEIRRD